MGWLAQRKHAASHPNSPRDQCSIQQMEIFPAIAEKCVTPIYKNSNKHHLSTDEVRKWMFLRAKENVARINFLSDGDDDVRKNLLHNFTTNLGS